MNYEKRYKNLVRAIKQLQETNPSDEGIQNWVNDTLYGTKENENEKNIKDLIDELKCSLRAANCQNEVCNGGHEKRIALLEWAIAWVEKQDSYYTFEIKKGHWYKCVCDYMLNGSDLMFKNGRLYYCRCDWRLGGEIDERNVKDIGVHGYKSFFRPATNQEIKDWLEKQGEISPVVSNSLNIGKREIDENNGKISELYEHIRNTCACIDDALSSESVVDIKDYLEQASDDAYKAFEWIEKMYGNPREIKGNEVKISLKWTEEDENMAESIIDYIKPMPIFFETTNGKSGKEYTKEFIKRSIKWLKTIKQKIKEQQ